MYNSFLMMISDWSVKYRVDAESITYSTYVNLMLIFGVYYCLPQELPDPVTALKTKTETGSYLF
jgi:hypothetical protein